MSLDMKSRELVMGKLYLKNKDYKMAERSFNDCLNANPEDTTAMKLLAQVHEHDRRYDKALELYERCYKLEPEKTGVLLDICRIIQVIGEPGDHRKWLNLGLKAFPSSPIVMSLKSFMNTQSTEKRDCVTIREASPRTSTSVDDCMAKILDKLSLLEKKESTASPLDESVGKILEKIALIEKRLSVIEENQKLGVSPAPTPAPASMFANSPATTPAPASMFANSPATTPARAPPATTPAPAPTSIFAPNLTPASIFAPTPASVPAPAPVPAPTQAPARAPTSLFSSPSNFTASSSIFGPVPTSSPASIFSTIPAPATPVSNPALATTPAPMSLFSQASTSAFSPSGNLFADSLTKLSLNNTSSPWAPPGGMGLGAKPGETPAPLFSFMQNSSIGKQEKQDDQGGEDDEDAKVPNEELAIEKTCDLKPIEIKTGEEDEDVLFQHRCKLYRFKDKEYKERGVGDIKVLKHRETGKGRLVMRRDAIGLVCLNCWDITNLERVKDNQLRFRAIDASDGTPEMSVFLIRFKTPELTDTFVSHLDSLLGSGNSSANTSISSPQPKNGTTKEYMSGASDKSEVEIVDPKLDQALVDKARELKLPDLFYHTLKNQEPHGSDCGGCKDD